MERCGESHQSSSFYTAFLASPSCSAWRYASMKKNINGECSRLEEH